MLQKLLTVTGFLSLGYLLYKSNKNIAQIRDDFLRKEVQLEELSYATKSLGEALSNNKSRGTLGENIAEDVISKLGLIEGTHFLKQSVTSSGSIPDFTFIYPNGLKLNLDSKFPLTNYLAHFRAEGTGERKVFLDKFLKDVRDRIKEVIKKDYIQPSAGTVDFALVFIPNDSIFYFIQENDFNITNFCLDHKVILTAPSTLYSILSLLKYSYEVFKLDKKQIDNMTALATFSKEWELYNKELDSIIKNIEGSGEAAAKLKGLRFKKMQKAIEEVI